MRLIDADALQEKVNKALQANLTISERPAVIKQEQLVLNWIDEQIDNADSIDVVRCEECLWLKETGGERNRR